MSRKRQKAYDRYSVPVIRVMYGQWTVLTIDHCSSFATFLPSPERVVDGCGVVDEKFVCVIEAGVNGCHTACQQRLAVLQFYNLLLWLYIYSFHTFFFYLITTLNFVRARSRSIKHERALLYSHLITTLSFARARSRSEEFEQARFFSHLITTLRPLWIYRPFAVGLPSSLRPSSVYQVPLNEE